MDENIDEKMDQSVPESTANAEHQDNVNEAEQSTFYTANEQSSVEEANAGIEQENAPIEEEITGNNGEEPSRQSEEMQDAKVDDEKSNNDNKKNKADDEGEVASDGEENGKKIEEVKNRKRPREKTLAEQYSEEPRTKKAALEQLKNMRFAAKDPFKENPLRDRPTMMTRHRERTPPRKTSREEEPRRRARDEPSAGGSRRRRSRSRSRGPGGGGGGRQKQQIDTTAESRHQRSTMFFLQNEQRAAAMAKQPRAAMPTKPLRDRIEMLLARPDCEIIALPAAEIRNLIVRGIDLYKEHEYFLTGRKAQLIELDAMIGREREDIERISQELPPQYRPPMFDEFVSSRRGDPQQPHDSNMTLQQQQQFLSGSQPQNAPSNYSIPPPGMDNEFRPPNSMQMPPSIPPSAQFARPPLQFPPPPFPSNPVAAAGAALPHFGQSPSLLFSKPPPSTAPTTKDANNPQTNTSIPPPNLPTDMQPSQSQPHSLVQNAPPPLPSTFSIPPPQIGANSQEQSTIGQKPKAPQSKTQIPSLLELF